MNNTQEIIEEIEAGEPRKLRFNVGAIFLILAALFKLIQLFPLSTLILNLKSVIYSVSLIALAIVTLIKKRGVPLVATSSIPLLISLTMFSSYGGILVKPAGIVRVIVHVSILFLALLDLNIEALKKYELVIKKAFYVVFAVYVILEMAGLISSNTYIIKNIISALTILAGLFLTGSWIADPYKKIRSASDNVSPSSEYFVSLGKHVVLMLFTCGIWLFMWIYRTTRLTNTVKDEPARTPSTSLLLCIFTPFYYIYWTYKTAGLIDKLAKEKNVQSDLSTICLILAIFVSFVPPILIQDKVNQIVTAPEQSAVAQPEKGADVSVSEFEKYKEMFEKGLITEEEYEAKRKQLLGL